MQNLGFALIDAHIHQWDPYNTPHSARLAVKLLGKHPHLLDKTIRWIKPKALIETLGRTEHVTSAYLPEHYARDLGFYPAEKVVHIEANWHDHKSKGVVGETEFIERLDFKNNGLALGAIVAAADPRDPNFKKILKLHHRASPHFRGIRKMAAVHEDRGIFA
ncbi:MAG: amidohydrolase, partial [Gammaproteobacteria bacterium]|nr:amidohydrolase [Gammaproteobacteria bacterium]